jgi:hypothetical protein
LSILRKLRQLSCLATYTSAACLNRVGDGVTRDRAEQPLQIFWQGAACIDAVSGQLHGYLPWYSSALSDQHVAGWANGSTLIYNIDNQPLISIPAAQRASMAFTAAGDLLTLRDKKLVIHDVPSGRVERELFTQLSDPLQMMVIRNQVVAFYARGLVTYNLDSSRTRWFAAAMKLTRDRKIVVRGDRLAFWDLQQIGLLSASANTVWLQNFGPANMTVLKFPFILGVGLADDGRILVAQLGSQDAPLQIRDLLANRAIGEIPVTPNAIAMSADAKRIATITSGDPAVMIWDVQSGQEIGRIPVNVQQDRMTFTPDGRYLVVELRPDSIAPAYR